MRSRPVAGGPVSSRIAPPFQALSSCTATVASIVARALVFGDYGRVTRNNALPGEVSEVIIASVGAGLRPSLAPHFNLRVDAAHVARGTAAHPRGDESVHFTIGVAY